MFLPPQGHTRGNHAQVYWALEFCARYGMVHLPRWDLANWSKRGGIFTYFIFYLSSQQIKCKKTGHGNPGTKISSNQTNKTGNCGPLHQKSSSRTRRRCICSILIGHYSIGTSKHQNKESDYIRFIFSFSHSFLLKTRQFETQPKLEVNFSISYGFSKENSLPLNGECNTWKYSNEGFNVVQQRS